MASKIIYEQGDTPYFHVAVNDQDGSAVDGSSPQAYLRKAGDPTNGAPTRTLMPALLSHGSYQAGCYEIAVTGGLTVNQEYAVFCSMAADGQNPVGLVGSFIVRPSGTSPWVRVNTDERATVLRHDGTQTFDHETDHVLVSGGDNMFDEFHDTLRTYHGSGSWLTSSLTLTNIAAAVAGYDLSGDSDTDTISGRLRQYLTMSGGTIVDNMLAGVGAAVCSEDVASGGFDTGTVGQRIESIFDQISLMSPHYEVFVTASYDQLYMNGTGLITVRAFLLLDGVLVTDPTSALITVYESNPSSPKWTAVSTTADANGVFHATQTPVTWVESSTAYVVKAEIVYDGVTYVSGDYLNT